jgi:hypothetical protein
MAWDLRMQDDFLRKLITVEHAAKHSNTFTGYEQDFIKDMRTKYDSRKGAIDLGISKLWEPTMKQLNFLMSLYESV